MTDIVVSLLLAVPVTGLTVGMVVMFVRRYDQPIFTHGDAK